MASKMATKTSSKNANLIFMQKLNIRAYNCTARVRRTCEIQRRSLQLFCTPCTCYPHSGMYIILPGLFRQLVDSLLCGGGRLYFKEHTFFILQVVSTVLINLIPPEVERLSICGKAKIAGKVIVSFWLCV